MKKAGKIVGICWIALHQMYTQTHTHHLVFKILGIVRIVGIFGILHIPNIIMWKVCLVVCTLTISAIRTRQFHKNSYPPSKLHQKKPTNKHRKKLPMNETQKLRLNTCAISHYYFH